MTTKKKITKAVIPAAGLGTRFLPATKAVPKELLPVVDRPTIQLIIQEAVSSGIETVILVTGMGKGAIEDHFDVHSDLEMKLESEGKHYLAERLRETHDMCQIVSIRQGVPLGLGHAVLCAKNLVGDEPFMVLLGDDLVDAEVPCAKQMIDAYEEHQKSIVALMEVHPDDVNKFGICAGDEISDKMIEVTKMVEKPALEDAPSRNAIVGRYILNPRIFELLERTSPGKGQEIQLTDAMAALMEEEGVLGYNFDGERYDAGDQLGFIKANIAYALKRPELADRLKDYLKTLI